MKNFVRFFIPVICTAIIFNACSIEKRHYRPGYHIEWKHKIKTVSPKPAGEDIAVEEHMREISNPAPETIKATPLVQPKNTIVPARVTAGTTPEISKKTIPAQKHFTEKILPGKKMEKLIPVQKISRYVPAPTSSNAALDDDGRLIIGIIFLIFGLSPFAVLIYNGPGPEFSLDFLLWILGLVFLIIGLASGIPGLAAVGWILLVVAFIYAIIAMIRRAV
jgi:hypothetical protein